MPVYRMRACLPDGTFLGPLPFSNLQGEFYRSKRDQIRFDLPLRDSRVTRDIVEAGRTETWVYRDNALIFAGPLWSIDTNSGDGKLSCTSEDLSSYFDVRRITTSKAFNEQRASICWKLISQSQAETNGQLYITSAALPSTPVVASTYDGVDGTMIADALDDHAKQLGFDYKVTPDRKFTVAYPRAQVPGQVRLTYPGNIISHSLQITGKFAMNDLLIKGAESTYNRFTDTTSRAYYGLRQGTMSNSDLVTSDQLIAYGTQEIALHKKPKVYPQVTVNSDLVNPFRGDVVRGSVVNVTVSDGWAQFDQQMIVNGWQVTVGKNFSESITLYLNDLREDNLDQDGDI